MRNTPNGSLDLLKFGPLPLALPLALIAVTMAPSGQAQVRTQTPVALPSPKPTPARTPGTARIRRAPGTETPTPSPSGPSSVYVQDREQVAPADEPSERRSVRTRRTRGDDAQAPRDPFEAEPDSTQSDSAPVRSRRVPVEATPSERDPAPVRARRAPVEETSTPDPSETTPVRMRRTPVEATPPERDPTPVRVRRRSVEETSTPDPSETTPVRMRRTPVEATPPERDPTPVRVRRTPMETYADTPTPAPSETTPVRSRRIPVEATPPPREPTPVRHRNIPVEEFQDSTPVRVRSVPTEIRPVRRTPVWQEPALDAPPQNTLSANLPSPNLPRKGGRCGAQTQAPMLARILRDDFDPAITSIAPPSEAATVSLQDTLTLRPGSHGDLMKTLPTLRQIPTSVLNGTSTVTIGKTRVDFKPMIQNPKALLNIAKRLRALPDQVEVCADVLEAMEIKQGLVVRSLLTYRILPGACSNEERRIKLAGSGVNCFTRSTAAQREAGLGNARSIRYVRDPGDRAKVLAASRLQASKIDGDIHQSVTAFRHQLNNLAQRAEVAAEVGDDELARLDALDDDALAGELANAAETKIEQVAFIPKSDQPLRTFTPAFASIDAVKRAPVPLDAIKPPPPVDVEYDIGSYVFLAGFTLAKEYEWKQRVDTTIKWCFVGCKKHYYAELFAGFEYGFGLRIPIKFGGTYNPTSDTKGMARLTASITPIDGTVADYKAAGLSDKLLFDGKEIVAEIWAHAGASAKLPIVGVLGPVVPIQIGKDFTDGLPAPLAHGQFTPPTPGVSSSQPTFEHVFDDVDLIGGRANFGILGGKLLPSVKVTLHSEEMSLTLTDKGGDTTLLSTDGQKVNVAVDKDDDKSSSFTVGDPLYTLGFNVTPGITARLFIDLAVWSNNWDWTIWFPQLAVDLPPGGVKFACHEGTICTRTFRFNQAGKQSKYEGDLVRWGKTFMPPWLPKCVDEPCKLGIRWIHQGVMYKGWQKFAADENVDITAMSDEFKAADENAKKVVVESQARKAQAASNSWGVIAQAIWTKQCKDSLCYDTITALAAQMGDRARQIVKANPNLAPLAVTQQVNKEFVPKFRQAVDESKLRDATEQAFETQRQLKKLKGKTPKMP